MKTIHVLGKPYEVRDQIEVRKRRYFLLQRLSTYQRERYLAVADQRGRRPQPVAVMILPGSQATRQHLEILDKVSAANDQVPTIIDFDVQGDRTVVVLKWIHGPTLAEFIEKVKADEWRPMSPTVAFQRIRGLAHLLWSRHDAQQIVHGDIKPSNIVVATRPGRFVLLDFGSAWQVHATAWRDPGDGISPIYAAPELQSGERLVDFRSDQFSVSVILYQLLTLQIPYGGMGGKIGLPEYRATKLPRIVPPSQLSQERRPIPDQIWEGLDRVTLRGLAFNPNERYPTPAAWLDDLREVNLDIQRPRTLSPVNDWLTQVVGWFARLFRLT